MLILVDATAHVFGFLLKLQVFQAVSQLGQLLGMVRVMVQGILKKRRRFGLAAQQAVVAAVMVAVRIIVRMAVPVIVLVGVRMFVVMILVMVMHLCNRLSICIRQVSVPVDILLQRPL